MAASPISYLIILTDATQYATLSAQYPNGIQIPPQQAATLYGLPIEPPVAAYPGVSVPLALAGDAGNSVAPYGIDILPAFFNTQTFTVPATGGYWAGGDFFWVGYFRMVVFVPPAAVVAKLGQRRWVDGAEIPQLGEGSTSVLVGMSRSASRTVDGRGFAYRAQAGDTPRSHAIPVAQQVPTSWERLYIRPLAFPVGGNDTFWAMQGSVILGDLGAVLALTPGGNIVGYSMGLTAYPGNLLFTSPALVLGARVRLDLRIHFRAQNVATEHGSLSLYINGVLAGTGQAPDGDTGLGTIQNHRGSQLGYLLSQPVAFGSEIDCDDWISANEIDIPAGPYPKVGTPGFDLTAGSHVVLARPTAFGPNHNSVAYVGAWQSALVNPPFNVDASVQIDSTTALSEIQVETDYDTKNPTVAIATSAMGATGSTDGTAALSAIGASAAVNLSATVQPSMLYSAPDDTRVDSAVLTIPSMTLQIVKSNNTNPLNVIGLLAAAEQYGNFGPDDAGAVAPAAVGESALGIHNAPYPHISAQVSVTAPAGQIQVHGFTYTGTGAGLELLLDLAPHWWFVRRIDLQSSGVFWWSSMETAHGWLAKTMIPNLLAQAGLNGAGQAFAEIVGTTVAANSVVGTYQVVAVSDPAMRYLINGAFAHLPALGAAVNALVDTAFTPEAAFFFIESTAAGGTGSFYKGIGHGAASASPLDAAVNNNVATLGLGSITSQAAIHIKVPQTAYSAWRRNDGSGNTGWIDLVSYVGNGAGGTRNIAVAIANKSPLFAIVTPHDGISYMRDPSNTGLHSQTFASVDSTTGIVGGDINVITVGVALNALGVTYDVFVIASNVASPGNWGTNPVTPFNPVPTIIRPTVGPWQPAPAPVPAPDGGCISLGTAITEVAYRLGDALATHWTSAELTRYLLEALRVWNALTLTARTRGSFVLTAATAFYDLPTKLPALLAHTLKDQDLVLDLEYLLQEPPTSTTWTGTAMFTLAQLTAALTRRRDLLLYTTGAVVTHETALVTADANGRVALPVDVIELRRAAWIAGALVSPLVRDSEWAMNAYNAAWPTPVVASATTPKAYSVGLTPPLTVQLAPPPTAQGTLDTVSVTLGAALDPATGVLLGVPDDFAWVVKWGALRDLLAVPGPANDPARAALAEQLWGLGLAASKVAAMVLDARINGTPVRITGVADADRFSRTWQGTQGAPKQVLAAGPNLIAVAPVPDNVTPYTLLLDVVRNQPVPVAVTDCYFEGGVAMTAALLDYATFCARFKEGPAQAEEATALLESFLKATGVAVALDRARLLTTRTPLLEESRRNEAITPREVTS